MFKHQFLLLSFIGLHVPSYPSQTTPQNPSPTITVDQLKNDPLMLAKILVELRYSMPIDENRLPKWLQKVMKVGKYSEIYLRSRAKKK